MKRHKRWRGLLWPVVGAAVLVAALFGLWAAVRTGWPGSARQVSPAPVNRGDYAILAYSELGMHCIQPDYSEFFILPPDNNLRVQVFDRRQEGRLVTEGIEVTYTVKANTTSAGKVNFWRYAESYGYRLAPDVGLTGNGLSGSMALDESGLFWSATAIPLVPYDDAATMVRPYQRAVITVRDRRTGKTLATLDDVVLPVSDEMECGGCHGHSQTGRKILRAHDRRTGTRLFPDLESGVRHRCNECHADPALDAPGKPGLPSLSQAIHGSHAVRMRMSRLEPPCYNCHPGSVTRCNRGVMFAQGLKCDDPGCHGPMAQVASSLSTGRTAWLDEPDCAQGGCHRPPFSANPGRLDRDSLLLDGPAAEMNGKILCGGCHNGAHAEWPSTVEVDNAVPRQLLGTASYINRCDVCHAEARRGRMHRARPEARG